MAHFAKLDNNNIVIDVNVVNNQELLDINGLESESKGIEFLINWSGGYTNWIQTSFNSTFRKNFAGIGYKYDKDLDAFIPPKPFNSWILDTNNANWMPPIPRPVDGKVYNWDESTQTWKSGTNEISIQEV
jgi:hypothetical protein